MTRSNLVLEDTTLRDGEQAPGVVFNREKKLTIFKMLYEAGVRWFEAGIPVMGGDELSALEEILSVKGDAMLLAWNRGVKKDLDISFKAGFNAVHIGLPVSEIHLTSSLKKGRAWLIETAVNLVRYAKDKGAYVSISAEDVGRADISFLEEYAGEVTRAGADRLRLSDTVGVLDFDRYDEIIRRVKAVTDIDLQCHTHNDFGLATANTIAGIKAGAKFFHVTVNGIGERAGMPDILQITTLLQKMYDIDLGIDLKKLIDVSYYVSKITGTGCFPWTPIIGENIFSHESGIHVNGMLNNKACFEPFSPSEFGRTSRLVIGKHSGTSTLNYYLEKEGFKPDKKDLIKCLEVVRRKSVEKEGELSVGELVDIYRDTTASNTAA